MLDLFLYTAKVLMEIDNFCHKRFLLKIIHENVLTLYKATADRLPHRN